MYRFVILDIAQCVHWLSRYELRFACHRSRVQSPAATFLHKSWTSYDCCLCVQSVVCEQKLCSAQSECRENVVRERASRLSIMSVACVMYAVDNETLALNDACT